MFISGSSPLTRGTRESVEKDRNKFRFIPAYAGNSFPAELRRRIVTVHPRLRGELLGMAAVIAVSSGSSPLTRGTHKPKNKRIKNDRFIPAYAGNSSGHATNGKPSTVHPRLRGELQRENYFSPQSSRFIPAYAGNSRGRECSISR